MNLRHSKFKFLATLLSVAILCYVFFLNHETLRYDILSSNASEKTSDTLLSPVINSKDLDLISMKENKAISEKLRKVSGMKVDAVNCRALFAGDPLENLKAERYHNGIQNVTLESYLPSDLKECKSYLASREYLFQPVNEEEANFPIAFSILVYKDFHQFEKLLRAIYRPQNYYCIHVDSKSDYKFKENVQSLVDCIDNEKLFILPASFDVQWATITVLKPEIECMKELWKRSLKETDTKLDSMSGKPGKTRRRPRWKYFINLTGQEFPLRTNLEIVRILKIFNGSNNVEATRARMAESTLQAFDSKPAPGGLKIWKGSVHVVLSREFVDFTLHHPISGKLVEYLNDFWVPDEHFFSTLNNNPNLTVPGGYTGSNPETNSQSNRFIARFKNWGYAPFGWPCKGKWVRQICNFGVGDLPLLASRDELFANKFDYSYQPLAYDCMEELLYNRTKLEYEREQKRKGGSLGLKVNSINPSIKIPKNLNGSEISKIIQENLVKHPELKDGSRNMDHLIFPDRIFNQYGDEEDGQNEKGNLAEETRNYLMSVRPMIHEPGEVDFDHYRQLDFVGNHFHVHDGWTFEEDSKHSSIFMANINKTNSNNSTSLA